MARCITCGRATGFFSEVCDICKEKRLTPEQREAAARKRKLSSISLVREASMQIYQHRVALSLAVILPILCSQVLRMSCIAYVCTGDEPPSRVVMFLFLFARLPFYVMFAAICHRIVLLGDGSLANRWGIFWSVRETKFAGWLIVLGAITFAVSQPIYYALLLPVRFLEISQAITFLEWAAPIALLVCTILSAYVDGRFGLALPATAVGNRMNLLKSWRATAGNGGTILVALLIPAAAISLIDYLLFGLLLDSESLILTFLRGLLYYPLIAIGIVIITIAYRELVLAAEGDAIVDGDRPQVRGESISD